MNSTVFEKKVIEHKMPVSIFCIILSETLFILRRTGWNMIKKCTLVLILWRLTTPIWVVLHH